MQDSLTRILGAKNPKAFYITREYGEHVEDDNNEYHYQFVINGFEIENGDIDNHSHFSIVYYEEGGFTVLSSRAWYNELEEFAGEQEERARKVLR